MAYIDRPEDLASRLARMEREMVNIRRMLGLQSAVIRQGTLALQEDARFDIVDRDGDLVARMGSLGYSYADGRSQQGLEFRYENADPALTIWRPTAVTQADRQYTAIWNGQRIVMSTDAVSGQGLARPWLDIPLHRVDTAVMPVNCGMPNTQSGSFVRMLEGWTNRQHPVLGVRLVMTNNGAEGEYQFRINNTPVKTVRSSGAVGDYFEFPVDDTLWPIDSTAVISFDLRRVSGAQTVFGAAWAWWRQS